MKKKERKKRRKSKEERERHELKKKESKKEREKKERKRVLSIMWVWWSILVDLIIFMYLLKCHLTYNLKFENTNSHHLTQNIELEWWESNQTKIALVGPRFMGDEWWKLSKPNIA